MNKITIVIPTFNSSETILECISSIVSVVSNELNSNVFVLFCDGGSTDGTVEIIESMKLSGVRLISESDNGIYDAMNKGVKMSLTDWVYFLGSDDCLLPGFLEMLEKLESTDKIYYGNVKLNSNNSIYSGIFSSYKLVLKNINHQSIIYSKKILLESPFELKYRYLSDWNTNIKLFKCFEYMPFVIARYNNVTGQSSINIDYDFYENKLNIVKENMSYFQYLFAVSLKLLGRLKNAIKM